MGRRSSLHNIGFTLTLRQAQGRLSVLSLRARKSLLPWWEKVRMRGNGESMTNENSRGYTLEMHGIMASEDPEWVEKYNAFIEATPGTARRFAS